MKLKFVNSLTEADTNKGKFLLLLAEIHETIKTAVEAKQYMFKDAKDKGFYILPKFGYLAKIGVEPFEKGFKVTAYNAQGKEMPDLTGIHIDTDDFFSNWENTICPTVIKSLIKADAEEATQLKESAISDATPKLNIFQNIKNTIDKRAAVKADKHNIKDLSKECQKILEKLIKNTAEKNSIKIKTTIANEKLEFALTSDYIVAAVYSLDSAVKLQANEHIINVTGYITSLGENKNVRCSLVTFTRFLNKKLGLNIQLKDEKILKATGASQTVIAKINDFETDLKDILGDNIIKILEESLNEDLNNNYTKYDKALAQIANDEEKGESLVKLYFFKETDKKIKLSDDGAKELYKKINAVKSFDASKSLLLSIVVKYFNKNNASNTIEEEIENLIYVLTVNNYAEKLKNIDDASIIYNSVFMKDDATSAATQEICDHHTAIRKSQKLSSTEKINRQLTQLKDKLPDINVPAGDSIKTATDLANFMVFKDENTVRDLAEIKSIYSIIEPDYYDRDPVSAKNNQLTANSQHKDEIKSKHIEDFKNVIANIDSNASIETIRRKLASQFAINPRMKAVLAQLLTKNENSNL